MVVLRYLKKQCIAAPSPCHRIFHHDYIGGSFIKRTVSSSSLSKDDDRKTVDRLAHDILGKPRFDKDGDSSTMRQRIALSKSITLVESKSNEKRLMADSLLAQLRNDPSSSRRAFRLGIAGPPGVGKSSLIEALALHILELDKNNKNKDSFCPEKIAVLCIDPSSHVTGGSILGDKTRMSRLSYHPNAYVRPSPTSGCLGGLGAYTYDAATLCEFANYELTIIETVGVGQTEVELANCCDLFLLLLAPGGGDELQGSKKGIVEVADFLVVNKADGELNDTARKTANEYKKAIGLLRKPPGWWGSDENDCSHDAKSPPVLLVSARTGVGISELWDEIVKFRRNGEISGYIHKKRILQRR